MNGDRKMPTATLMPSADQLEPTFFRMRLFSYFSMRDGGNYVAARVMIGKIAITSLHPDDCLSAARTKTMLTAVCGGLTNQNGLPHSQVTAARSQGTIPQGTIPRGQPCKNAASAGDNSKETKSAGCARI